MKFNQKLLWAMLFSGATLLSPLSSAAENNSSTSANIEVVPDDEKTTQEELAAIFVLSEICPNLIGKSKAFDQGYARLVKDYWQDQGNPVQSLAARAQQDSFKKYLTEARQNAQSVSTQNNRDVCTDVIAYR